MRHCPFYVVKLAVVVEVVGGKWHFFVVVVLPFDLDFAFLAHFKDFRDGGEGRDAGRRRGGLTSFRLVERGDGD